MNQVESVPAHGSAVLRWVGTIIFLILGAPLIWGGIRLVGLGGSPYYIIAGLLLVVTAILILRRQRAALWLYAALLLGTILWALAEVGLDCWALTPRLTGPAILGLWFAIPAVRRGLARGPQIPGAAIALPALFVVASGLIIGSYWAKRFDPLPAGRAATAVAGDPTQWLNYANDVGGSHFTTAGQITPANA